MYILKELKASFAYFIWKGDQAKKRTQNVQKCGVLGFSVSTSA